MFFNTVQSAIIGDGVRLQPNQFEALRKGLRAKYSNREVRLLLCAGVDGVCHANACVGVVL